MPLQPALLAGALIGVLSGLPVVSLGNCCCCMWIVGGGMLAAYLDQAPERAGNIARGALDGLLAGVVGAFVFLMVSSVVSTVMAPIQAQMFERLLSGPYDLPPEVRDWLERARVSEGGFFEQVGLFVLHLLAGVLFGALGGLLGALFFWRTDLPPAIGGHQPPPPIPPQL
jgi:hypothetical protein